MEQRLEEAHAEFRRASALEEAVLREWDDYVATTPTLPQGARRWITPIGKRREELAAVAKVRAAREDRRLADEAAALARRELREAQEQERLAKARISAAEAKV